jgi:hypothetical protein
VVAFKIIFMGMYMYVSEEDRIYKRSVSDLDVNESFQEALRCDPSLMIEERKYTKKRKFFSSWFREEKTQLTYNIYHETPALDGSAYQARYQWSGSGSKNVALAYLHGIINGVTNLKSKLIQ